MLVLVLVVLVLSWPVFVVSFDVVNGIDVVVFVVAVCVDVVNSHSTEYSFERNRRISIEEG